MYIKAARSKGASVLNMLRSLHFLFLLLVVAFVASVPVSEQVAENGPSNVEKGAIIGREEANDLEADATSYAGYYRRPWGYYGGWRGGWGNGGWGGRGWGGRGWGGQGWNGGWW